MAYASDVLACADVRTGELHLIWPHHRTGRAGRVVVARGTSNAMTAVRAACVPMPGGKRGAVRIPGVAEAASRGEAMLALLAFAEGVERRAW